jgi:hypothetical protein
MKKELEYFAKALDSPQRPFLANLPKYFIVVTLIEFGNFRLFLAEPKWPTRFS